MGCRRATDAYKSQKLSPGICHTGKFPLSLCLRKSNQVKYHKKVIYINYHALNSLFPPVVKKHSEALTALIFPWILYQNQ